MPSKLSKSLWDDADPLYAPFQKRIKGAWYWIPSKRYKDAGYSIKTYRLSDQSPDGDKARAAQCRELTRELMLWWDGEQDQKISEDTWGWLANRYLTDSYSAFHDVRPATRQKYRDVIGRITDAIGDVKIGDTDYPMMAEWTANMRANGRSVDYIKRWWTHFGLFLSHGVKIGAEGAATVKAIRSEMRIKTPPAKQSSATRKEVEAIVAEADKRGMRMLSLAVLMRYELLLRGIDLYGEWTAADGRQGGIQMAGRIWDGGLTWDMFTADLSCFTKTISKTRDSLPEPYTFDLSPLPEIRSRLNGIAPAARVGPVFTDEDGLPPRNNKLTRQFAAVRSDLGLPETLKLMDLRASGITEARGLVDPYLLRDASQHTQISTTDRYVRGRSDAANKVVQMRGNR